MTSFSKLTRSIGLFIPMELTKNPANRSAHPHLHYLFRGICWQTVWQTLFVLRPSSSLLPFFFVRHKLQNFVCAALHHPAYFSMPDREMNSSFFRCVIILLLMPAWSLSSAGVIFLSIIILKSLLYCTAIRFSSDRFCFKSLVYHITKSLIFLSFYYSKNM